MSRIVVGIDASDHAVRALRWAFREAVLRDADLELVHAYTRPGAVYYADVAVSHLPTDEELLRAARQVIEDAVGKVVPRPDVPTTMTVQAGGAAGVLCSRANDADLVVIRVRGLGGFRGLLLGSVSQQVIVHSPCPVVIVPPERRHAD